MEPQKPFACTMPDCGMSFINEDHLQVHTKKHDMVLQLGTEQKAVFVADQTPTPTRFIRNCEEVGLFQDLQNVNVNVNPFDEGFKRAMEAKAGLSIDGSSSSDNVLHTPQLMFPNLTEAEALYSTTNNQRNITISRSSSDESGAIKEYETTRISKLTNEVTISRVTSITDKTTSDDISIVRHKETTNRDETVYTNNVIKIQSNNKETKLITLTETKKQEQLPIMSQKSLDQVVDSLTDNNTTDDSAMLVMTLKKNFVSNVDKAMKDNEVIADKQSKNEPEKDKSNKVGDYEVIIKLPNQKVLRMKEVKETSDNSESEATVKNNAREILKETLIKKSNATNQSVNPINNSLVMLPQGTNMLYPVALVGPIAPIILNNTKNKMPIAMLKQNFNKPAKRRTVNNNGPNKDKLVKKNEKTDGNNMKSSENRVCAAFLERRSAAQKRYRDRLKETMQSNQVDNVHLKAKNRMLMEENIKLKKMIMDHKRKCTESDDLCLTETKEPSKS